MLQDMPKVGNVGSGGSEWIEATYSNSNKTIEFNWDFDAKTAVFVGVLSTGATYKEISVINLQNGNSYRAMNSSGGVYWYGATTLSAEGYTVDAINSKKLQLSHSATFSSCYLCPIVDDSILAYFS